MLAEVLTSNIWGLILLDVHIKRTDHSSCSGSSVIPMSDVVSKQVRTATKPKGSDREEDSVHLARSSDQAYWLGMPQPTILALCFDSDLCAVAPCTSPWCSP